MHLHRHTNTDTRLTCREIDARGHETQISYEFHTVEPTARQLRPPARKACGGKHKGTQTLKKRGCKTFCCVVKRGPEDLETRKSLLRWMNELFFFILRGVGGWGGILPALYVGNYKLPH